MNAKLQLEKILEEVSLSNTFVIKTYVLDVKYEKAFLSDVKSRGNKVLNAKKVMRPEIISQV